MAPSSEPAALSRAPRTRDGHRWPAVAGRRPFSCRSRGDPRSGRVGFRVAFSGRLGDGAPMRHVPGRRPARAKSRPAAVATFSPSCSRRCRVRTSSTAPSGRSPSWNGPNDTRISRFTASPRWPSTFFTSRFLPSRMAKVSHTLAPCSRSSRASIAPVGHAVDLDAVAQAVEAKLGDRAIGANPVAPAPASRRQFQRAREPAVIGEQQQPLGVGVEPPDADQPRQVLRQRVEHRRRPCGSAWVVTSPRVLWNRNSRVRSRTGNGLPSTTTRSSGVTLRAGEVIFSPLTTTRPAAIQASASRRDASPARAIALAMRSPS